MMMNMTRTIPKLFFPRRLCVSPLYHLFLCRPDMCGRSLLESLLRNRNWCHQDPSTCHMLNIYIYIYICTCVCVYIYLFILDSILLYYIILYYIILCYVILYYIIFNFLDLQCSRTRRTAPQSHGRNFLCDPQGGSRSQIKI